MRLHRALPLAIILSCAFWSATQTGRAGSPPVRRSAVVQAVDRAKAAVVNIHSERTARGPSTVDEVFAMGPSQNKANGMGTGIVIDPRGYIVTNHHVIEDVNVIRVRLADGTTHIARIWAKDRDSDLAI